MRQDIAALEPRGCTPFVQQTFQCRDTVPKTCFEVGVLARSRRIQRKGAILSPRLAVVLHCVAVGDAGPQHGLDLGMCHKRSESLDRTVQQTLISLARAVEAVPHGTLDERQRF